MYDARGSSQPVAGGLGFGLAVIGVVTVVFFAILNMPSMTGPGKSPVEKTRADTAPETTLFTTFEDEATRDYIAALRETFPSAASDLEDAVRKASARDADRVELGLLVLQAGADDIATSAGRLARADVEHVNALLDLSQTALQDLSRSGAPYCKGSDLIHFASLSEQQLYSAVFDRVGHGAGLYEFGLELNTILLDAIRDARASPVLHGQLSAPDQQALQRLGLAVMTDPQIVRLLTTEGKSRSEMDAVMRDVNFCDLGVKILGRVDELPDTTKGRVWAEAMRQIESGNWRYTLYRYTGY